MTGTVLSHYEVLQKLGEGGMGVVYKGRDTRLDRFVALKLLPANATANPERKLRFIQEARAASALNHPNIVTIYDIDSTGGVDLIAMEYVAGQTLAQSIPPGGLPHETLLDYARQIADALAAAHAAGIVHRDLKPANVMVSGDGRIKVLDFGLAKLAAEDTTITGTGTVVGTAAYMSPEQVEGRPVDARSDLFSFGALLYEMACGRPAFRRGSVLTTLAAVLREEPPPLLDVPPELLSVIARCLKKELAERFQRAAEVQRALQQVGRPAAAEPAIAVLPFANLSADKENEYFSDGLAEEVINALTSLPGLRVVARTSAFAFRGKEQDVREIGARLNVGLILEGSVRKAGSRIRVTAQLIKAEDGYHLWSERYDREMTDVFAIQDEISQGIMDKLRTCLAGERPRVRRHTENLEAYDLYIQGLYQSNRLSQEGFQKAVECFHRAIGQDPQFAPAWAKLAHTYAVAGLWGYLQAGEVLPKAEAAARRALQRDHTLADAHAALAVVHWLYHWDPVASEREVKCAVELNPNDPFARSLLSMFLGSMKRDHPASVAEAQVAQELDPLSLPVKSNAGWVYYWARQFDRAIAQSRKALEMDENCLQAHYILGLASLAKSSWDEGVAVLEKAASVFGDSVSVAWLGMAYAIAGRHGRARAVLGQLEQRARSQHVLPICFAYVHLGLGEDDKALEWLEKAYEQHDSHLLFLGVSPIYDPLRSHPHFRGLLRKMNLEP